jgi:type IV pilus assembly protein PilQ
VRGNGAGGMTVVVSGDGPIATYESFTLPDPPRLVLDIPNATHAIPQPITAQSPAVKAIRSSQYRERPVKIVRLVIDLRSALPYRVETADNQLRVQLGTPGGSGSMAQAAAPVPAAVPASTGKVTRVSVQNARGRQRILIGTSGRVAYNVTEASDPPSLTVDVTGATIDTAAARSLDLRQVASSVSRLRASQYRTEPDQVVRIVADLRNPTRYEVQQTGSAILVDLQATPARATVTPTVAAQAATPPLAPEPAEKPAALPPQAAPVTPPPPAATPAAGRLSMDFKDADINNLLRIIAEVSGMNVVAGSDVTGKVTVRLVNVEWQQALDVILKINNMGYEIDGNIIRVAPLAKLAAERKAREEARSASAKAQRDEQATKVDLEPLQTEVIAVNYAKAVDVVKNLDRLKTTGRTDTSIAVDERTNKLIIKETRDTVEKMARLLKQLDQATPQVLIEARLVEATRSFSQSLGVEWGFAANLNLSNLQAPPVSVFGSPAGSGTTITAPTVGNIPIALSFPASVAGVAVTPGVGIVANNLFNDKLALQTRLSAAEAESRVKTLSAPKVATLDNQEAEIRQGQQVPYTTVDSSGRTVVAFQDAFIRLKVTPHITNDRRVSMKVEAERTLPGARIDFAGGFAFPLQQRKASTNVLVTNGSTIVIGGLLQTDDSVTDAGVPWLMRLPILGSLFKVHSIGPNDRIELLIFLTPTILEEARLS